MKFLHTFLITLIFISFLPFSINAENDVFVVLDEKSELKETFEDYDKAYSFYMEHLDGFDNLLMFSGDKIIFMEYGVVEFVSDEACGLNIEYYSLSKKEDDMLNGCYGADGAYLQTSEDGKEVKFMVSGDIGTVDIDKIILHPLESLEKKLSVYHNGEKFTHNIISQFDYDFYSYSLELDDGLSDLEKKDYYSYDGHYFYDDFRIMIDDYRNSSRENSVNDKAYYNYYQYLPHRSLSAYTYEEVNDYFINTLGINKRLNHYYDHNFDAAADEVNRSQLYDNIDHFFVCENIYGTNAMMLFSSAMFESSYGRSFDSYAGNNLYFAAAYENDEENSNRHYDSIAESIYSHAKYYISSRYSNHLRSDYHGTFYGNKLGGINVNYALDHYFGEKSASFYYQLDSSLGYKDKDQYALGIINDKQNVSFYFDEELSRHRFNLNDISELSFVLIGENENSYKINIDKSYDNDYHYDFDESIAYVSKESFSCLLNEDKILKKNIETVHYDFNEGQIFETGEIDALENSFFRPYKPHYEFTGFDENNVAQYIHIDRIELLNPFVEVMELNGQIDLGKASIRVFYDNGEYKDIELNSDMISYFDNSSEGIKDIVIGYNGLSLTKQIEVSSELNKIKERIDKAIADNDPDNLRNDLKVLDYPLSFKQIRSLDQLMSKNSKRNYVIEEQRGHYDASFSGLDLSLQEKNGLKIFGDTYYAVIKNIPYSDERIILRHGKGYGLENVEGFNLSFRFNFEKIELCAPIVVQIKIADKKDDLIYTVYHLNSDNDVVKMRTTQSDNYIQFMAEESGSYMVFSKQSYNRYHIDDGVENLNHENMGVDNHRNNFRLFMIGVIALLGIIGIVLYFNINNRNEQLWKDFKKSLRMPESVQEEEPKS